MKPFLSEDFLLETQTARTLYHEHVAHMPIIDYHCHLPPQEIAENKQFENLTKIWLYGDHYKWRAMRTNGIEEKYCTGEAFDYAKFEKWAETVPYTMRNPLYHWTHMELKNPFGITQLLNVHTAREIYEECTSLLQTPEFSVKEILRKMKVKVICTTDDPTDSLEFHKQLATDGFEIKVFPTFRPDKGMAPENPEAFNVWIDKLSAITNTDIRDFDTYLAAIRQRHDFFASQGCKLSDHGIETFYAAESTETETKAIFSKVRSGKALNGEEILKFKSAMLLEFARLDHEKGWTQQFHYGALRNNNSRMMRTLGPDTGWDSIGDFEAGRPMSSFFDRLDTSNQLTKTIIYNLNPRDNELIATMIGNFNDGSVPGKMQFGSGWWFLDQKDGMTRQMNTLSNMGLLSRFVGMITDSRSFLSYPRHEYFRRILCNLIGNDVENGELPAEMEWLGQMAENICYHNARNYFGFDIE
ncbi:glucuronate isomerase [Rhodocytophaga rosea]|uniref:Uronate isomerase n=1 Tax=Rhodocytophaga rosea TaxID=2704465 RepID=A0A6C0GPZ3_9BACT|nr:glucuronate isomerase [Rhodocytophaga rosea]QHT70145.1 glucuronate isomerase [Rhodocytophaga rosea]